MNAFTRQDTAELRLELNAAWEIVRKTRFAFDQVCRALEKTRNAWAEERARADHHKSRCATLRLELRAIKENT